MRFYIFAKYHLLNTPNKSTSLNSNTTCKIISQNQKDLNISVTSFESTGNRLCARLNIQKLLEELLFKEPLAETVGFEPTDGFRSSNDFEPLNLLFVLSLSLPKSPYFIIIFGQNSHVFMNFARFLREICEKKYLKSFHIFMFIRCKKHKKELINNERQLQKGKTTIGKNA